MSLKPDELAALAALEEAWGLKRLPSPKETKQLRRAAAATGVTEDDGAMPPNFLLIPRTEYEEVGMETPRRRIEWLDRLECAYFTLTTPRLTAMVCVGVSLATAGILLVVLWR